MQTIVELSTMSAAPVVEYPIQLLTEPEYVLKDWELNKVQRDSLEALTIFHDATADILIRKLGLSPNSLRYLQKHLSALYPKKPEEEADRYVEVIIPPKQPHIRYGSTPFVYRLGRRGHALMKSEGKVTGRYRPIYEEMHKPIPLRHRLGVNEFLLKALLLEEHFSGVSLLSYEHEKSLNNNPFKVPLLKDSGDRKITKLSADLALHFSVEQPRHQYRFLPEINLSEVWQKDWRERIRAYIGLISAFNGPSVYEQRFGTDVLTTVPVIIASSVDFPRRDLSVLTDAEWEERKREQQRRQHRMETLLTWTEAELTKLGLQQEADLFSFSAAPLDEIPAYDLFFSPIWVIPFDRTPRPLMQYGKGAGDV